MSLGAAIANLDVTILSAPAAIGTAPSLAVPVSADFLRRKTATVGGLVGGSPLDCLWWLSGCCDQIEAAMEVRAGWWSPTEFFRELESSEKGAASYRLGMSLSAVVSELLLGLPLLVHRQWVFGTSRSTRGDLLGWSPWFPGFAAVEAKGRSRAPTIPALEDAKDQAELLAEEIALVPWPVAGASWAVVSVAWTGRYYLLVDDPPAEPPASAPPAAEHPGDDVLRWHYETFIYLAEAVGLSTAPAVLQTEALGAFLPGSDIWVGVEAPLVGPVLEGNGLSDALRARAEARTSLTSLALLDGYVVRRIPR